jgi:hypothetical protein
MDLHDVYLDKPAEPPEEPRRGYPWAWIAFGILVVLCAVAYLAFSNRETPDQVSVTGVSPVAPKQAIPPPRPLGADAPAIELPPLDRSDALVRELVRTLSAHPAMTAWLARDNLLRSLVAATHNIAAGRSAAAQARELAPTGPFTVAERQGAVFIDPRSYQRYDRIADAVASIDATDAARLYGSLKPRLIEAHQELGVPSDLDRVLEQAFMRLLAVPVLDGPVAVRPKSVSYVYADERLEELAPAQKQLLRMGPRNTRLIQNKLREIGLALGMELQS